MILRPQAKSACHACIAVAQGHDSASVSIKVFLGFRFTLGQRRRIIVLKLHRARFACVRAEGSRSRQAGVVVPAAVGVDYCMQWFSAYRAKVQQLTRSVLTSADAVRVS